ncbi:sensor histidine kinase [Larkinella insperata]|uniref:Sensor histidine kinase n=1 Tax=Larkinella insperata TaxID=332158 RepID=A0ABW3QJ14_9BACT|nr:histidine kinase [Larkinella insperata]
MREITGVRRYELWFAIYVAVIYVIRRLIQEAGRIDDMVESLLRNSNGRPASVVLQDLERYNHTLHNNVPLIVGVLLFLLAWFVFHYLAYPAIQDGEQSEKTMLYAGLTVLLLLGSVASYHYLKWRPVFREDGFGGLLGIRLYSMYSKRNVLADTIGLGIIVFAYELISQLGYDLDRKYRKDFKFVSYLIWVPVAIFMLTFALFVQLPETLWRSSFAGTLLILATIIQIYLLQNVVYKSILPSVQDSRTTEFFGRVLVLLLLWLLLNLIVWGARTQFTYSGSGLNTGLLLVTLFAAGLMAVLRRITNKEKVQLQTQVSQTSAELAGLQSQINPHFLFNALNSLYSTALQENSEKTADGIQKLGDMMRFMLQENNRDRIPLEKEIEYLQNYIQLQRMRLDESHGIEIRVTISEPNRDISIAPMMLIPFVENAFKHGISLRNPSWIFITLTLDLTTLYFKVHNSRHPAPASDPERDRSGIGLENVRKRLELIYPGRYSLAIQASEQDYFVALTIRY